MTIEKKGPKSFEEQSRIQKNVNKNWGLLKKHKKRTIQIHKKNPEQVQILSKFKTIFLLVFFKVSQYKYRAFLKVVKTDKLETLKTN